MKLFLKIIVILLGIGFMFSCKVKNQEIFNKIDTNYIPYYLKVYEADSLYLIKNYGRSYSILDSLFKVYKPLNLEKYKEYETYISCAFALDLKMSFKDSILKSIENYGSNSRYFKYDSLMNLAYKKAKISNEESLKSTKIYLSKLNFQLRDSIKLMCQEDQRVRRNKKNYDNQMRMIDSINEIKLKVIIDKYGYPHEKLIGEYYIDSIDVNLSTIFLHTDEDFRINYLLPKILIAVKLGKAYPELYSVSLDRYLESKTEKQLYGSYNLSRDRKHTSVSNFDKLDSIRKSIGLPSTTYMNWRRKIKYGF